MASPNRIASMVGKIKANLPTTLQPWALSLMFNSQVNNFDVSYSYRRSSTLSGAGFVGSTCRENVSFHCHTLLAN